MGTSTVSGTAGAGGRSAVSDRLDTLCQSQSERQSEASPPHTWHTVHSYSGSIRYLASEKGDRESLKE